jgi:hypothetical protein
MVLGLYPDDLFDQCFYGVLLHWQNDFEEHPKLRHGNGRCFFSHPDFQVPEEEMGQHGGCHVMVPSGKFSHLVVGHSQFGLGSSALSKIDPFVLSGIDPLSVQLLFGWF